MKISTTRGSGDSLLESQNMVVKWMHRADERSMPCRNEAGALLFASGLYEGLVPSVWIEDDRGRVILTDAQIRQRLRSNSN
jgi:hypothetical protein